METQNLDIDPEIRQSFVDDGITELNPPQEDAVDAGVLEGEDMVVASPTASGKTLVAELALTKKTVEGDGMTVYVVPLKALASEKYEDFSERYENLDVRMSVGDYDSGGDNLDAADVLIATSEKLDSLLRHSPSWISRIDLVVVDEIHLLNSANRGPTLEVTLTKLRDTLDFQLLGLSATISNAFEMAGWLDAELVESDYRPVELEQAVAEAEHLEYYEPDEHSAPQDDVSSDSSFSKASDHDKGFEPEREVELAGESRETPVRVVEDTLDKDKQAIVFTSSRKGAEKSSDRNAEVVEQELSRQEKEELDGYANQVLNALGSPTSQCRRLAENLRKGAAFHHAGLCVAGDSMVIHPDGTFSRMDELVENDRQRTIGLSEYKTVDNRIVDKYEMDQKPLLEIKTRRGREIKVSKNHSLPVMRETGLEWVRAKNLSEGVRIAAPRRIEIDADEIRTRSLLRDEVRTYRIYDEVDNLIQGVEAEDLEMDFCQRYRQDRNISVGGLRELCETIGKDTDQYLEYVIPKGAQKPVKIPEKIDEEFAWLVGAVAGDGYINDSKVFLTGSADDLLNKFSRIATRKFERKPSESEREDGVKTYTLSAKAVSDILVDHFGIPEQQKASNLAMPSVSLPDNLLGAYIRGLFDTDGSVSHRNNREGSPCVEFYTASDRLATEIHTSLLRFEIHAYRDKRQVSGRETEINDRIVRTNNDIHRLTIYGSTQLRRFRDKIGFTHSGKKTRLDTAIQENPLADRRQNDVIPKELASRVSKIRNQENITLQQLEPEVPKSTLSRFESHKNPIKRDTFQELTAQLGNSELNQIANSDIIWEKITSIQTREPEKLYDISTSTHNFVANGILAHNTTEQRQLVEEAFRKGLVKTVSATPTLAAGVNLPAFRVVIRDLKRYTGSGMDFIPVLEYMQMVGRAGRPGFDDRGEAISVAKNSGMTGEIVERYIAGEPEKIRSKLAAEPVLRMHTLSLVASRYTKSREEILEFFEETFYAYQFGDFSEIERKLDSTVEDLRDYGFMQEDEFEATDTGERVAELYIDPDSANLMLESLRAADSMDETRPVSYLFMLARTSEMAPRPNLKSGEGTEIERALQDARTYLLESVPQEWDPSYDLYLECMKLALMLRAWISEVDEERIMEKYGVAPGGVRAKNRNADWLLYSAQELCRLEDIDQQEELERLRRRMRHGIKEELLPLVKFDQIGRVRARKLMEHGIDTQQRIREVRFEKLKKLIGDSTARTLKEQVGEENIFDRENIMDYFDE